MSSPANVAPTSKVMTRKEVLENVLQVEKDEPLFLAISQSGIKTIADLLSMKSSAIEKLSWLGDDAKTHYLAEHDKAKLEILKAWNYHLITNTNLAQVEWTDGNIISGDEYDMFRVTIYDPDINPRLAIPPNPKHGYTTPPPFKAGSSYSKPPPTPASEFRKSTKRDKTHYAVLKDEKQWADWRRKAISTAYTHGCENVFSSAYSPKTPEDILLFREQNNFMYDVFNTVVMTPMGKHFIRTHEATRDAQAVWDDYSKFMRKSTRADIEKEDLITALTSNRFDVNKHTSAQQFIIQWLEHLRLYEDLTPLSSHFPEEVKKTMLKNALGQSGAFNGARALEELDISKGEGELPYEKYVGFVQRIAAGFDNKSKKPHQPPRSALRTVHQHIASDITEDDLWDYSAPEPEPQYSMEADELTDHMTSLSINEAYRRRRPSVPRDIWRSIPKEDQDVWDQISDASKLKFMFAYKNPPNRQRRVPGNPSSTPQVETEGRHVNVNELDHALVEETTGNGSPTNSQGSGDSVVLVNAASTRIGNPADIRNVLANTMGTKQLLTTNPGGKTPRPRTKVDTHEITPSNPTYRVSRHQRITHGSLVDRGANGGIAGPNLRVIAKTDRSVDVSGIDDHRMTDLSIVTAGGIVQSQNGPVLAIFHQYALAPHGKTIHSSIQLEHFKNKVDDRSVKIQGGTQTITTLEGYKFPLSFHNGLAYLEVRPFTDEEWNHLTHVVLTSDVEWDPSILDHELDIPEWSATVPDPDILHDQIGGLHHLETLDTLAFDTELRPPSRRHFAKYRDYFLRADLEVIRKTFLCTTQFARSGWITGHIFDTHKSPFPALNVQRRNEPVATDTVYSDTPALGSGATVAQFYAGVLSKFCDAYGMRSDNQFVYTLLDTIRKRGAMDKLISDRAQVEVSKKAQDILRHYCIQEWQSEPHYQQQNPAERRFRDVKSNTNRILNTTGAPGSAWLLCLQYVCFIMNRTAVESLGWRTPFERLTGSTPDISMIYRFKFWDPVYYKRDETRGGNGFPSLSNELKGNFVGFSESVGHSMTYKIYAPSTQRILYRSRIKLASIEPNLRLEDGTNNQAGEEDEDADPGINSPDDDSVPDQPQDSEPVRSNERPMAILDVNDLIGRSYLSEPLEDGRRFRLRIVEAMNENERGRLNDPSVVRFRCQSSDNSYEEIQTYNDLLDKIEEEEDGTNGEWRFRSIDDHQGPLRPNDPDYLGSAWNVRVNWENGETTFEPLSLIAKSDPVSCAIYAKENDLLHLDGWKRFARLARRQKKLNRMLNQAKLQSFRERPVFKFGFQVARNHAHAMELDACNGNDRWKKAEEVEIGQIDAYDTFEDHGKGGSPPRGYKRVRVHLVYDIKFDGRHKARLVAGGHLTETPVESVYSSVVSLRGLRISLFIAELNKIEAWTTDVGNAYLEALTKEKLYIIAGPEFGSRQGHTLVIRRALYGLKSSGKRWWERCSEVLSSMGFRQSKAEDDIWIRETTEGHYEYIARYVDDLAIVSRNPKNIIDDLEGTHGFKLKGTGPISYHLGCDFFRDSDGVLSMAPKKYIDKIMEGYVNMFGSKPRQNVSSPLEKGDHPELDFSEELGEDETKQFQSLIGSLQWLVSLGRFDIATAVMTLSKFRAAPRKGHLDRAKRVYGYLAKMKHGTIRFRVDKPDYSDIPLHHYDWEASVYGDVKELIPDDAPKPLGPEVVVTIYVDANLMHDVSTGRAVTGVLHFLNQTPIDWFTKKQPTVETATYGSEFMAARTATEQTLDLRTTLRYLGINVTGPAMMFGDNKSVVDSASIPHSRLHKRHVLLSFHRVREAIAAGIVRFIHIPSEMNPADILSKAWGYQQVWPLLKPILFWEGNTGWLLVSNDGESIPVRNDGE